MKENSETFLEKLKRRFHDNKWVARFLIFFAVLAAIISFLANLKTIWPYESTLENEKVLTGTIDSNKTDTQNTVTKVPSLLSKKPNKIPPLPKTSLIITGMVQDDLTNELLDDVVVSTIDENGTTVRSKTDGSGNFKLDMNYSKSTQKVSVTLNYVKSGYKPAKNTETINFDNTDLITHSTTAILHKVKSEK